jgi:glutathione synthase/RimK-type ligase-like ATP-grasp enzyme
MILVWGSRSDSPTTRVHDALLARGAPTLWLDTDGLDAVEADLVFGSRVEGMLSVEGRRFDVGEITGFYLRPVEPRVPSGRATRAVDSLLGLAAALDARVINRPHFSRANNSKPYQLRLIRAFGLDVPETLVTTDVSAARAFAESHGKVVYKSISGIRSIVSTLPAKLARLDSVADGPVQLQERIAGVDVRVHVVGERTFACEARSRATDYRYAARQGFDVDLRAVEIPQGLARHIVSMSRAMGLHFAGVDFRRTPEGRWVCLEVNPSPAFTWYEDATEHRIAAAVAALLQGSQEKEMPVQTLDAVAVGP